MGIMTNRNACSGMLVLFLTALAVLAGIQFGFSETQDIRKAAIDGDAHAQFLVGFAYETGLFGAPQDYKEAAKWYRKAAEQGHARAQDALALLYVVGQGVPQDYHGAVWWYRKAAEQGYAGGQYSLGRFCHEPDAWLFGGIYRVVERHPHPDGYYDVELTNQANGFIGRLMLRYDHSRTARVDLENYYRRLEVLEILREPYSG